jgi:myosin heavy subunit
MQQMRKLSNASINSNLDTITALTKELVTLREQHRKDMTVLRELQVENAGIMTPLETSSSDLQQLDAELDAFYKQKKDLQARRQQLRQAEEELSDIKWDHEVLFQEYERLEQECKERKKSYQEALYAAQQKSNMKNLRLEQKLAAKTLKEEQAKGVLSQIMLKSNVDLDMIDNSIVSDIVAEKTNRVKMLNNELSRIKDAHSAMMKRHGGLIKDGR